MRIIMPSEEEKDRTIKRIVNEGVRGKTRFAPALSRMVKAIGFRYVFFGSSDAIVASVMLGAVVLICAASVTMSNLLETDSACLTVSFLSPAVYAALCLLTEQKEKMLKTHEVLMSCRYNLRHLTAFRQLIIAAAGLVFAVIMASATWLFAPVSAYTDAPPLFVVSVSATLLYSALTLSVLLIGRAYWLRFTIPVLWCSLHAVPVLILGPSETNAQMEHLPTIAFGIVAMLSLVVFASEIRALLLYPPRVARSGD
jgi:hypothetical protein